MHPVIGFLVWFCSISLVMGEPQKGDKLYLQGMGGKAETYFQDPYVMGDIIREQPNIVIDTQKTEYGRLMETHAQSEIMCDRNKVTAQLTNFRDLKILDAQGKVLLRHKAEGATSLYEIRHKDKTIAWAVGWHKNKREAYKNVDFTSFRLFVPLYKSGTWHIEQKALKGLLQSAYEKTLKNKDACVLVEAQNLGCEAMGCYYCMPNFYVVDETYGIRNLSDESLGRHIPAYIDIHQFTPEQSLMYLYWMALNLKGGYAMLGYVKSQYDQIVKGLEQMAGRADEGSSDKTRLLEISRLAREYKPKAMGHVQGIYEKGIASPHRVISACFPFLLEHDPCKSWFSEKFLKGFKKH